jgi:hypothetical protein
MKMTNAKKDTLTIVVDPTKIARGHMAHRSGAGKHGDRRLKRLRTRSTATRFTMAD